MSTQIIPLEQINFEQWLPLWQGYLTFYKTQLSDEQIRLSWKRITNPEQAELFGFAILVNNQIAGFMHLNSQMSTWAKLPYCYLQDLYVDEQFRNQGLARKLIEFSYAFCEGKFDRVFWVTQESNQTARYLYDKVATKTDFIQYRKML